MTYTERIQADLKKAMLNKETDKVRTFRMLISKLKDKKIELIRNLEEKDEIAVIKKAAKERRESYETYKNAGRKDLANAEKAELDIINVYLPAELDDTKIETIVKDVINETGAESMRDMGKVMKGSMARVAGLADGKRVQEIVKKHLG